MKLRIRGNSVRLRLMKDEVARLRDVGIVSESTRFPGSKFTYSVAREEGAHMASFVNGNVSIQLNATAVVEWANNEEEGIYFNIGSGDEELRVMIEKDYACLTVREGEDDTHAYPNPNETC